MDRILLIEDNKIVSKALSGILKANDFKVDCVFSAEEALIEFNKFQYSLLILDLNLPKMSGYGFLQVIRKKSDVPVIINTSHASVKHRIKLINIGASDFIEKSFEKNEILESVRAILEVRKTANETSKVIIYKDLEIDFTARIVKKKGIVVELTSKEFDILKSLFFNPTRAFSRKQIYLVVWGEEYSESVDNTINVHFKRLRNKIETTPNKPEIIETVYAYGYRLGKPVVEMLQRLEWN